MDLLNLVIINLKAIQIHNIVELLVRLESQRQLNSVEN